uniref:DUF2723 domain-containing protein n=1 Tax=Capitella teleta TaxID=283909 RepID=X1Z2A4_CAPTE
MNWSNSFVDASYLAHFLSRKFSKRRESLDEDSDSWSRDVKISTVLGSILLAIYLRTMYPSIAGGDSGELIVSAHELGVAHPPGYPLFTMLAKATMTLIPFGKIAWRVNFLNACCGAAAGATLQLAVLRVTSCFGSSLLAFSLFSFSRLTWTWSASAEVFALNNFLIAVIILIAVIFEQTTDPLKLLKIARLGAFMCGLSLCNQHTSVIYVFVIAMWVFVRLLFNRILSWTVIGAIVACFCAGLLPYLYLPLSAYLHLARWTWGDQLSIGGFIIHFLRAEYGTFQLGKDHEGAGCKQGLIAYYSHFITEYSLISVYLVVLGIAVALRRAIWEKKFALFAFVVMVMGYTSFFAWRANLNLSNPLLRGVVERFWMQSDLVFIFLLGVALNSITRFLTTTVWGSDRVSLAYVFACMTGCIITCLQLVRLKFKNYSLYDNGSNVVVRDFGLTLLKSFPPDSLVLTKGDLPTNAMRYLHLCESIRPDVSLLDVEILSYQWSLPRLGKFFPEVDFPGDYWHLTNQVHSDGRKSFNFKSFIDANYIGKRRPIYVCIGMQDKDPSWMEEYHLWPHGACHRILSQKEIINLTEWGDHTAPIADAWRYPHDGYGNSSWEKVANDEMWNAKISSAFFFYQRGERCEDPFEKTKLFQASYEVKEKKKLLPPKSKPSFWHKNFGLVCERLLRSEHTSLSKLPLCKLSIQHFKQYLSLAPNDPDNHKIVNAIEVLQERLKFYSQMKTVDNTIMNMLHRVEEREHKEG